MGTPISKLPPEFTNAAKQRFWSHVDTSGECWNWMLSTDQRGYGQVGFSPSQKTHHTYATHRLAWILANGEINDGLFVLHKCDNPRCVRPDHLFLGTHQDNMDDMVKKDRHRKDNWKRIKRIKLTFELAEEMRRLRSQGFTTTDLMLKYDVRRHTVSRIVNHVRWNSKIHAR